MNGQVFLTPEGTSRAIWFDFEGRIDAPPTVLGVLEDDAISQWIVEALSSTCADRRPARAATREFGAIACCEALIRKDPIAGPLHGSAGVDNS